MNLSFISFKSQSLKMSVINNQQPKVVKFEKEDDNSKDLYLALAGLATASAVGYGAYRYIKSGKMPKVKKAPELNPEVKPLIQPTPPIDTKKTETVINEIKQDTSSVRKLDMSPENIEAFEFSKIVDIAINHKKEFAELLEKYKVESELIDGMLKETDNFKNRRLYDSFNSLKSLYLKSQQLLATLSKEMDKMKMVSVSPKNKEDRIIEIIDIQQKAKGEILELSELKKQISETYESLKPLMDAITETKY